MGTITVKRKAYTRKDGTRVKASTYQTPDKGQKGKTPSSGKWFVKRTHTGWKKTQKADTRRRKLLEATDKRRSLHARYVEAGRMAQQLANVTADPETKRKATADAQHFFLRAKE